MSRSQSYCVSCCALIFVLALSSQMIYLKPISSRATMYAEIGVSLHILNGTMSLYIEYFGDYTVYKPGVTMMMGCTKSKVGISAC